MESGVESKTVRYESKSVGWEIAALITSFFIIATASILFILLVFRAAQLIGMSNSGIDPNLYRVTHTYIVLIEILLWSIMAKAAVRFKAYAREIMPSKDGIALNYIATAMLLSILYAILFDMASTFKTLFINSPLLHFVTTISNYIPLALFLVLSIFLYIGTVKLKEVLPDETTTKQHFMLSIAVSIVIYIAAVIPYARYFYHVAPIMLDDDGLRHFILSPGILTITYIVPFSIIWLLGILSCINLADYANRVRGKIYRPMFKNLYLGILIAYVSSFFIQIWYVSNLSSNKFGVGMYSLIVLILLLIAGFGLMYRGANRLYRLEK